MPPTVHDLDVRPLLAAGRSPLAAILAAVAALPPGGVLRLCAPFEPQPLYAKLAELGLEPTATREADGSFSVLFTSRTIYLDLRLLEPPEPMQRTLEAAATLAPRARIVSRTRFRPVHLLAMLAEQGFVATCAEQPDGSWENTIARAPAPAA